LKAAVMASRLSWLRFALSAFDAFWAWSSAFALGRMLTTIRTPGSSVTTCSSWTPYAENVPPDPCSS